MIYSSDTRYECFLPLLLALGSGILLHGLHDTLLKRDMGVLALLTAGVSFALVFRLHDPVVRDERQLAPAAV